MRTFLKILITVVVIVGGFVVYLVTQPASALRSTATSRPVVPPFQQNNAGLLISQGENAWVRQFDEQGRLASRFRAAKWEPQKSGLVRVVRPEAELFLKAGKGKPRPLVIITGDDGEVVVQSLPDVAHADATLGAKPGAPAPGGKSMGQIQAPSSGRLNGVVIRVFQNEDDKEPAVTLKTNNIVFDNETFRISTETFTDAEGKTVSPDEVPVSVEGPYFDFYGRGLTVRWNDLEERLDLLRIAQGEKLVIKDVEALSGDGLPFSAPGATPKRSGQARAAAAGMTGWPLIASADPDVAVSLAAADASAGPATTTAPASRPARRKDKSAGKDDEQPPYRATFNDQVRVFQGEDQRAAGDLLNVDFLPGERKDPATRPTTTTAPAVGDAANSSATQPSSTQPAATQPAETQPADTQPLATSQPATAPAPQPVTVYWTGEFTVTPAPIDADDPLPPGEARVELVGAPLVLTRDALDIRSASLVFRTDGKLSLDSSEEFPDVLLTRRPTEGDGPDTTVVTEKLEYDTREKVVTLRGASRVSAPVDAPGGEAAPEMIRVAWREAATFHLVGENESDMWVDRADLAGDVDVQAPQGVVRSQRLELAFDAPAPSDSKPTTAPADRPQPNLRRVVATEKVYCELVDPKKGRQTLDCQRLALDMAKSPEGDLFPRVVDASGAVRAAATDEQLAADQQIEAGRVLLHLRPVTKVVDASEEKPSAESVELESLVATESVRVSSKEGGAATGKKLEVTVAPDGAARIELSGDPAGVEDGRGGTLTGPRIVVDPRSGVAHVPGAGTLRAVRREASDPPDAKGQPIEITWSDRADVKADANRIEVAGAVSLWLTEADGSVGTATAGRVVVELADKPPEEVPKAEGKVKKQPDKEEDDAPGIRLSGAMQTDLFKNKEVAKVHMYDDAVVNSKLSAEDGSVLQQRHLKADAITYDVRARHLAVSGPGQMLIESHDAKADSGKQDGDGKEKQANALAAGNGATAFQWSTGLEYEEAAGRATMNGSVIVSHQPDDKKQPPVRLDAERVTAAFMPKPAGARAARSAKKDEPDGPQLELRSIVADGQVLISREGVELSAQRVEYDPSTHWVIARGNERNPAVFSHPSGVGTMRATALRLNTLTWTVQITDVNTRVGDLSR